MLKAGLDGAYVTVDDTGARHAGESGHATQIGYDCYSARDLSADRRQQPVNQLTLPGSKLGAESRSSSRERRYCGISRRRFTAAEPRRRCRLAIRRWQERAGREQCSDKTRRDEMTQLWSPCFPVAIPGKQEDRIPTLMH